ncbi:MAG: UdgX family uracil-DNA binding protein [Micrococcales bacterium]|nr:UdgX family uracil-DNA binding protein [Micrococcales bacterium]
MAEIERPGAQQWVPAGAGIAELRVAASGCRGCELWEPATQVVFSAGTASARLVLVGEQPGDQEDRQGTPFVGPAGQLLARAVDAAGIARSEVYVTNAVKHFRFTERGKRRLHEKPGIAHIDACRPWLHAELDVVQPRVVVCLGATAGRSVLGREVKIGAERGRILGGEGAAVLITAHPSSLLRMQEPADRDAAFDALVADLRTAAAAAAQGAAE